MSRISPDGTRRQGAPSTRQPLHVPGTPGEPPAHSEPVVMCELAGCCKASVRRLMGKHFINRILHRNGTYWCQPSALSPPPGGPGLGFRGSKPREPGAGALMGQCLSPTKPRPLRGSPRAGAHWQTLWTSPHCDKASVAGTPWGAPMPRRAQPSGGRHPGSQELGVVRAGVGHCTGPGRVLGKQQRGRRWPGWEQRPGPGLSSRGRPSPGHGGPSRGREHSAEQRTSSRRPMTSHSSYSPRG